MLNGLDVTLLWCSVILPAGVLGTLGAIDFRDPDDHLCRRPRAYGLTLLSIGVLAALSLLAAPVWDNLAALESLDPDGLRFLRVLLAGRLGPAACLAMAGAGAMLVSAAHARSGHSPGCRGCGYAFDRAARINITRCPECGAPWRWIGGLRTCASWDPARLMLGAMLLLAAAALAGVLSL